MSCTRCRYEVVEGSRSTAGGNEALGYDQTGCSQPLVLEAYDLCEPAAVLVEALMIGRSHSAGDCPWKDEPQREPPKGLRSVGPPPATKRLADA